MAAGGKQSVIVKLTRMGDANGAATVRFKNLPAGIVAPAEVTDAGRAERSQRGAVGHGRRGGRADGAGREWFAKVKDRTVNLESEPVNIEITK